MWRVYVPRKVVRNLARMPRADTVRIFATLDSLKLDPFGGDVRKLGPVSYRRRVGAYRILFDIACGRPETGRSCAGSACRYRRAGYNGSGSAEIGSVTSWPVPDSVT